MAASQGTSDDGMNRTSDDGMNHYVIKEVLVELAAVAEEVIAAADAAEARMDELDETNESLIEQRVAPTVCRGRDLSHSTRSLGCAAPWPRTPLVSTAKRPGSLLLGGPTWRPLL
jgi:hypothetical protein